MKQGNTQSGLTVIELIMSIVISFLLVFGFSQLGADAFRIALGMNKSLLAEDWTDEVRRFISRSNECTLNFGNKGLRPSLQGSTYLSELWRHDANDQPTGIIAEVNSVFQGMKLSRMELVHIAYISTNTAAINLVVTFESLNESAIPVQPKIIPLVVRENQSEIIECWSRDVLPHYVLDRICEAAGEDGYDHEVGKCLTANAEWIPGNKDTAVCPPTHRTRRSPSTNDCSVSTVGGDPNEDDFSVEIPTRGAPFSVRRPPAVKNYDSENNRCVCGYATDISGADGVCKIRCIRE